MIKLPLVPPTADTDAGLTATVSGKSGKGTTGINDDFLSLFGKALPGQVMLEESETFSLSAALKKVTDKNIAAEDADAGRTTLAELLNGLHADRPDALTALLANTGKIIAPDKTALKDAAADGAHDLNSADMQALSALFAMLPQQSSATPVAKSSTASLNDGEDILTPGTLPGGRSAQTNTVPDYAANEPAAQDINPDSRFAVKTTAQAAQQTVDNTALPAAAVDKDGRDNTISYNTAPNVSVAQALSSATVSTPIGTHIATPVAPQISAQLGSQEWQQALSQQVTLFTRQGQQSAELRLHPEDLGHIQISLKLDDNQAQLQMASPHGHVRAALEATLPALRTALAESGIQLGQSSINSGDNFGQQQQSGQQQASARSTDSFPSAGSEAESTAAPASIQRLALGNNAVDIFA